MHLAPEVNKLNDYTFLSDIYSCGMTLYRLVNGDIYLSNLSRLNLRQQIKGGKFPDRKKYREFVPISLKRVINKALNVLPNERFRTAEAMRHALEQVPLFIDWTEHLLSNGIEWSALHDNNAYSVKRTKNKKGSWDVEVKKGKSVAELRKVNRLCVESATLTQAIKHTKEVLQIFVTGKES